MPVVAAVVVAATWAVAIPGSFDAYQLPKLVVAGLAVGTDVTERRTLERKAAEESADKWSRE